MARRSLWFGVVLVALLVAAAWLGFGRQQSKPNSTLTIGLELEPDRLSPLVAKNPKTFIVLMQIYEGLLTLDERGQIKPGIAESWATPDGGKTWLFKIRSNAAFHDSEIFGAARTRPITVDDAVWSFTKICAPGTYASFVLSDVIVGCADHNAGKAPSVAGVSAKDGSTLQVTLAKPELFFPFRLTTGWMAVMPKELDAPENKDRWGLSIAVGSGPYRLVRNTDTDIVLEANDKYWDVARRPSIKSLHYRVIKNDQLRFGELEKGGIDFMAVPTVMMPRVVDGPRMPKVDITARVSLAEAPTFNSHFIGFNLNLLTDAHLRRAMYFGVNRKELVDKLLYGYGDVTGGTVPPGINGYRPLFETDKLFDQQRAKDELAKSNYRGQEIELLVHDQAGSEQIGQVLQSQLAAIGVKVRLTKSDMNGVIGRILKGDAPAFSMFIEYVFSSAEPILLNMFPSSKRPIPNFWQYSNAQVDNALEELRGLAADSSNGRSAEIEARVMRDAPGLFLFRQVNLYAHTKRLANININGHGHVMLERATLSN
jgi:peptide/nickel transport system substrate-binding protein